MEALNKFQAQGRSPFVWLLALARVTGIAINSLYLEIESTVSPKYAVKISNALVKP